MSNTLTPEKLKDILTFDELKKLEKEFSIEKAILFRPRTAFKAVSFTEDYPPFLQFLSYFY